ncbi:GntR family transcriptional regulator [Paralimibaculum aggregatum]|uniref:GntR family transcriptional regulator n=1 Tax=Paralimibaculum aggregatum TaxID=3036245 RepID=A0ABQ6LHC7_9RHOB|nr:GntR family transcriptional regulator [Limibaculum sp. NKW23]GMG82407.1 GntR family transcriptional regulator [Limibaculum sp. NKW23]
MTDDSAKFERPDDGAAEPEQQSGATLTDRAYRRLEELIVTLRYAPGQVLSEAQLAAELGIGRTPVREALQRLASEGLVVVLPRRGILVSEINISRHLQLLEIRRVLERFIAEAAARRASAAERAAFRQIAEAFGRSADEDDPVTFMRLDRRFNRLTVEASHNEYAANAMRQIQGLSRRFWYRHYEAVLDLPRCARLHQAVAVAIAEGEPGAAGAASDALLDYIEEFARLTI